MRNESRAAVGSCSHRFRPVSSCWSLPFDWQLRTCLPHDCCWRCRRCCCWYAEGLLSWQKHTPTADPATIQIKYLIFSMKKHVIIMLINDQFDGEYSPCDKTMGPVFKWKRWIENSVVLVWGTFIYRRGFSYILYIYPSHMHNGIRSSLFMQQLSPGC